MPDSRFIAVIPTFREMENLPELTGQLWKKLPEAAALLVDDGSDDGTSAWVKSHPLYGERLFILERPAKMGLGSAYRDGFSWALQHGYSVIAQMDADLSHDPGELAVMLAKINAGSDIVLGSRYISGVRVLNWPISRLLLSLAAGLYVRLLTRMPFSDPTGGFKCFRASVLEALPFRETHSNGYAFQIEMTHAAWKRGYSITEIPIVFEDRHHGISKMSGNIVQEAIWITLKLAFQ